MLFEALPHPAIIAHRGASAYAPENTLARSAGATTEADGISWMPSFLLMGTSWSSTIRPSIEQHPFMEK
jgi:hypothetical protein